MTSRFKKVELCLDMLIKKMKNIIKNSKGFTLIELLVVIAIIAVLAVAVILTLNPAELLKQARDSTRISDVSTLKSAISLYLADVTSPTIGSSTSPLMGYISVASSSMTALCNFRFTKTTSCQNNNNAAFGVDGSGWVPVNFTAISSGAPIGNLPRDPSNTAPGGNVSSTNLFYSYTASTTVLTFELDAKMESSKYAAGAANVESVDGGDKVDIYEVGTNLTL